MNLAIRFPLCNGKDFFIAPIYISFSTYFPTKALFLCDFDLRLTRWKKPDRDALVTRQYFTDYCGEMSMNGLQLSSYDSCDDSDDLSLAATAKLVKRQDNRRHGRKLSKRQVYQDAEDRKCLLGDEDEDIDLV